jgi:hypothetical protein
MKIEKDLLPGLCRALLLGCVLLLPLASCNFTGLPEYKLSVTLEPGVQGTPASGDQLLQDLTEVDYKYTPANSKHTIEMFINDIRQSDVEDTLTMYTNITIVARLVDIRASWDVTSTDSSSKVSTFTIVFSGPDLLGGSFSDSRGYTGTWTAASNVTKITYSNWEKYILTGTVFGMTGTWANGTATGTWSAARK